MDVTYGIIQEKHEADENKRKSYGIAAYSDIKQNGTACILYAAQDLSCDRKSLEPLVERLNREGASKEHFDEIVEDFLATV